MNKLKPFKLTWFVLPVTLWPLLACFAGSTATAIPPGRPANYEIQIATPTLDPAQITPTIEVVGEVAIIAPLSDAPTYTPDPNALIVTPTPVIIVVTATPEQITATPVITVVVAPTSPPRPTATPAPPQQGGEWDFESDFVPWPNPYGEPCPGAAVASAWTAFVENGPYGSSCMNENLYQPNVQSGLKSQEITFDFIAANSGVLRTIPTAPGHRYSIKAFAKHDHSISPVEMALGVDLTGGTSWAAETVQWFPWDGSAEDAWVETEETITASGEQLTIFIKGFHPVADQGGKTVIDNVSVTDLGPE
jgi:hypothetical protein